MKLREWIYQAAMQMKVLSPETPHIVEVDVVHMSGRQHCCNDKARKQQLYRGLRQQHDIRWRLRELGSSIELRKRYTETSCERQELVNGLMEVGLTGSTLRTGKPATCLYRKVQARGSGQQWCNATRYKADIQKSGRQHGKQT